MKISWSGIFLFLATVCGTSALSSAESARSLVEQGNAAYAAKQYEEALSAYATAGAELPESARLSFNKGAAHYMKGDYTKARTAFEEAALKSTDSDLESRSMYNLGNCAFREAERLRDSDPAGALEFCGESSRHYQQALELEPDFKEAGENLEIVRRVMKTIRDEINRQNQEQDQDQNQKQQQDQPQDPAKQNEAGTEQPQEQEQDQEQEEAGQQESSGEKTNETDETNNDKEPSERTEAGRDQAPDEEPEQPVVQLNEEALDILEEEEDNRERRRLPVRGGYRDVDKNW